MPEMGSSLETGRERSGEAKSESYASLSEACALSRDAAKLLVISGSEMYAYEDWVDIVEAVEVVLPRMDGRGSSCHIDVPTSTLPYSLP